MQTDGVTFSRPQANVRTRRDGVLERVTAIIDVLSAGDTFASLEGVTAATGIPRSTTFRLLTQLVELGWLDHDGRGYHLGRRAQIFQEPPPPPDYTNLRAAASAVLNELSLRTGAVCHLGVLDGSSVHYLDKVGAAAASIPTHVGARLDADRTVTGRALLAKLRPEQVDELFVGDRHGSARTITALQCLHEDLNRIRSCRGLAYSTGDRCTTGISAVAAPVMGPNGAVAAISLAARRLMPMHAIAPLVATAARSTSDRLYPKWQTGQQNLVAAAG